MSNSLNVLPFNVRTDATGAKGTALPPLVQSARLNAEKQLQPLLNTLFNKVDDALFDLANKAENNAQQAVYFDLMRELRLRKEALLEKFNTQYQIEFSAALNGEQGGSDEPVMLELALIDDADLEETIALRNMVDKARDLYADALYCLNRRVQTATQDGDVDKEPSEEENPFDPAALCESFRAAIAMVAMELTARLVVYKLFDKIVVQHLDVFYSAANTIFARGGVLPDLQGRPQTSSVVKVSGRSRGAAHSHNGQAVSASVAQPNNETRQAVELSAEQMETFTLMQQLLAVQRDQHSDAPLSREETVAAAFSVDEVLTSLSALQPHFAAAVSSDELSNLRNQLQMNIQQQGLGSGREFSQNQADIIDVVGMMFDFILDDPELPVAVKGVLARLQIPMLKVALLDRNFFGKKSHPARLLLNELARAGMGLDEVADVTTSPVFGKIELIVGRILQEFDDDLLLFAELRQELQEFYTQEQAQLEQVRITLEQSHATASEAMAPLLAVDILPDAVRELLEGAWSEHLVELYRASGSKCEAWQRAAALATTLVDSLQPKQGAVERKALARLLPSLLVDLRRFSVVANLPAEESQRFFKALEECHLEGLRSREVEKPATPTASLKPVAEQRAGKPVLLEAEQVRQTAGRVMSAKELGTLLDDLPLPAPTSTRQQPVMAPAEEVASAVLMQAESEDSAAADQTVAATTSADKGPFTEEIVMSSEMPAGQEEDRQWAEQYATYASMARELEVGSWLNFTDENGRVRRGKLAWKSVVMGEYVFVDRFFKVVRDINLQQLVTALANGQVSLADEKPLMDRALDSVMSALKKYQDKVGGQAASQD